MTTLSMLGILRRSAIIVALIALPTGAFASAATTCKSSAFALQVLGSGGPIADDGRASSGYLVWVDGKSRFLIDTGGGTFLRFAEAAASFADLDLIGISHFHADHSADLPAILKSGYFAKRQRDLAISGPGGGGPFPGLSRYLDAMLDRNDGAYGYLAGYLDGSGGLPTLRQIEVGSDQQGSVTILGDSNSSASVDAMHVPHAIVPALAYRVRVGDQRIVFSSDQNGSDENFITFAKDSDVLVMHMPVPEGVSGVGRKLHAPPSVIGDIAARAGVKKLVLSHFMARSLSDIDENVAIIRSHYNGPIHISQDLDCMAVGK